MNMPSSTLCGLYILLFLVGSVAAMDVPWVFNKSSNISNYTSGQIENISEHTPQIANVPPIHTSLNNETIKNISGLNRTNFLQSPEYSIRESTSIGQDWFITGNNYYDDGNYNKSIEYYQRAIQENPLLTEAWYNKGNALCKLGRYGEAISAFECALKINPDFTKAKKNLQAVQQELNLPH